MSLGLLHFKPASEMKAEEAIEQQRADEERRLQAVETSLAGHIRSAFEAAKTAKQPIENRLLDCARSQKGEYEST